MADNSLSILGNLPPRRPARGVTAADVDRAADSLLRQAERPTVEKIRAALGTGSPNTINPLLDAWWQRLSSRLDAGPAALHRLPESVAHVAEALWMQALEEGRRRATLERAKDQRAVAELQSSLEVRSHVLSLREGELDHRLRERERTVQGLEEQLRAMTTLLRKEQASRDAAHARTEQLEQEIAGLRERLGLILSRAISKARTKTQPPPDKKVAARTRKKPTARAKRVKKKARKRR